MLTIVITPHPQPLPASGEGRQSVALAGWGSSGLISNQADMISLAIFLNGIERSLKVTKRLGRKQRQE